MSRVLFIGKGSTAVAWYRCFLPAQFLGCDWVGMSGDYPKVRYHTGQVGGRTQVPDLHDYEVVVLQQPVGPGWFRAILAMRERGIKVIYECDDYVHAIRKMADHDYAGDWGPQVLRDVERNMAACDALIVSTEFLRVKYRAFNKHVFVCRNALDLGRYRLTRPKRDTVNIGWAGGTGHDRALEAWLPAVVTAMDRHPEAHFVSIGQPFAARLAAGTPRLADRCLAVPFTLIEQYPAAMTNLDIALAPAGRGLFHRGKSDLRFIEAGALGIPTIADPGVYNTIIDGATGFHAHSPAAAGELLEALVGDASLRLEVGDSARDYVEAERDMRVGAKQWSDVIGRVCGEVVAP